MSERLFTIGHSTHPFEHFLELLLRHGIKALADIRRFPGSRRYPHFNRDNLATALPQAGIEYHWFEALGGRRGKSEAASSQNQSQNLGLRNGSFRNYADYMLTGDFQAAVDELLELSRQKTTAFMCSEGLFWRCHRRLVSDFLLTKGITVRHIMPSGELRPHTLTAGANVERGVLTYPSDASGQASLSFSP